jgi:uncharacterized protein YbaR (Trm112 family)
METVKCPECKFTLNADLFKDGLVIKGVCPRCQTRLIYDPNKRSEFATREQVKPILSHKMKLPMGIAIGLVLGCAVLFLFRPLFSVGVAKENQDPWASFEEPTPIPRPTVRPTVRPTSIPQLRLIDFYEINDSFDTTFGEKTRLTDYQQEKLWESEYKDHPVRWTGTVNDVSEFLGTITVFVKIDNALIALDPDMNHSDGRRLIDLYRGDMFSFSGTLDKVRGGTLSARVTIKDARLIEPPRR